MEDINFLEDFYLPKAADEKLLNSNAYKALKRNNIDTYELDGVPKDPDAELLNLDPKPDEKEARSYALTLAKFFVNDLPKDAMLNMIEGGTHALDKIGHFGEFANKLMNYPIEGQKFKNFDDKLVGVRNNIEKIREDSPLVSELLTFPMAEVPYAVPLYKKFRKMKMSRSKSLILSAAIGGGIAYSPEATFFLDSKMARGLKEFMNIADNTPEAELYDTAWQMGEYGLTGLLLHKVVDAAKAYKKIKKKRELITDTAQIAAGATVIGSSIKEEKPVIDVSKKQVMKN